jgi:hypothetical protein
LRVVVIDLLETWIVGMTVIEVLAIGLPAIEVLAIEVLAIVNIPVATLLVVVLPLEIVLSVLGMVLHVEMNETGDGEGATVGPHSLVVPYHHREEEVRETEVVVQRPATGEEIEIAMTGMIGTTEMTCETFGTMAMISVPVFLSTILTIQTNMMIKTSLRIKRPYSFQNCLRCVVT